MSSSALAASKYNLLEIEQDMAVTALGAGNAAIIGPTPGLPPQQWELVRFPERQYATGRWCLFQCESAAGLWPESVVNDLGTMGEWRLRPIM
jgi:hypothetical protein